MFTDGSSLETHHITGNNYIYYFRIFDDVLYYHVPGLVREKGVVYRQNLSLTYQMSEVVFANVEGFGISGKTIYYIRDGRLYHEPLSNR
jgi:hypothetical protein